MTRDCSVNTAIIFADELVLFRCVTSPIASFSAPNFLWFVRDLLLPAGEKLTLQLSADAKDSVALAVEVVQHSLEAIDRQAQVRFFIQSPKKKKEKRRSDSTLTFSLNILMVCLFPSLSPLLHFVPLLSLLYPSFLNSLCSNARRPGLV